MADDTFMDRVRMFFGLRQGPPRHDFRNPIWGSDDEDDGDELYTREHNIEVYGDYDIHRELSKHMHEMFKSFGGMFGDMKSFFHEDFAQFDAISGPDELPAEAESFDSNSIRNYYLKPGFHNTLDQENAKQDIDLDGKISSQQISGLLKKNDDEQGNTVKPFDSSLVPGRSFCKTIITTSVTKPDGTIETRRIVKDGRDVVEETTTCTERSSGPNNPGITTIAAPGIIFSEFASMFRNFY